MQIQNYSLFSADGQRNIETFLPLISYENTAKSNDNASLIPRRKKCAVDSVGVVKTLPLFYTGKGSNFFFSDDARNDKRSNIGQTNKLYFAEKSMFSSWYSQVSFSSSGNGGKDRGADSCWQVRYTFAILALIGIALMYAMRVVLSIAIVAMVGSSAHHGSEDDGNHTAEAQDLSNICPDTRHHLNGTSSSPAVVSHYDSPILSLVTHSPGVSLCYPPRFLNLI